ncbi:DgyrCDS7644 [Dimorphilus gyrociliatus]|uniref:DgyrCDS7644 n=1 Tax=Dimorphilus gyrociliatus TaxID=2664684 RepID=A0A7I8VRN9_9ANNE|nr:DgyrCDS7644 [Dimorphilus gyrociliatus]
MFQSFFSCVDQASLNASAVRPLSAFHQQQSPGAVKNDYIARLNALNQALYDSEVNNWTAALKRFDKKLLKMPMPKFGGGKIIRDTASITNKVTPDNHLQLQLAVKEKLEIRRKPRRDPPIALVEGVQVIKDSNTERKSIQPRNAGHMKLLLRASVSNGPVQTAAVQTERLRRAGMMQSPKDFTVKTERIRSVGGSLPSAKSGDIRRRKQSFKPTYSTRNSIGTSIEQELHPIARKYDLKGATTPNPPASTPIERPYSGKNVVHLLPPKKFEQGREVFPEDPMIYNYRMPLNHRGPRNYSFRHHRAPMETSYTVTGYSRGIMIDNRTKESANGYNHTNGVIKRGRETEDSSVRSREDGENIEEFDKNNDTENSYSSPPSSPVETKS